MAKLNKQTVDLSKELATAERQLVRVSFASVSSFEGEAVADEDRLWQNALYLPFQAAIYEMQSSANGRSHTQPKQRTEL